ncbi:MAG: aminopeptidase N [Oligoflexia bacterium]|nr:aminopeptidase N [Oligoflexia bacterium]
MSKNPQPIYLKDYRAPLFAIKSIDLVFDLFEDYTNVSSTLKVERIGEHKESLFLNGQSLELTSIKLDGNDSLNYDSDEKGLFVHDLPKTFTLEIGTKIKPQENLSLEGLYKSGGMFCTQCESEGFRKITYYPDRPDVMSVYTTTIIADKKRYPILLSNGNLLEKKDVSDDRHLAKWNDPFKKPAYLFALVAGDLGMISDHFITRSGRKVRLEIYVDKGNEDRAGHAMESLKKSMKWDEEVYGLEYDLDIFMIVGVNDFNFGAMENKGLNIFNANYVLAKPTTATDTDYQAIEGVVGHEYFHNWTGNRVTCRDWFQLSLKEGLTVYRDQEFSADMTSRAVCRISDANSLRIGQYPEDAGPMAHPIRPTSYIEINNFYTATVYSKGAEVIRMIATLLGKEGFRKGIDKYFELFDGQAVTTEDFVHAMEVANGVDLTQFRESWYNQAGTPKIKVNTNFDASKKTLQVKLEQSCPPTPGQPVKKPFHIPFKMALFTNNGHKAHERLIELKESVSELKFDGVESKPALSLLRDFSAPVTIDYSYTREELFTLLRYDDDPFARWEAGQAFALTLLSELISKHVKGEELATDEEFISVMGKMASDEKIDYAFRAQLLTLPEEGYVGQRQATIIVDSVHDSLSFLGKEMAKKNEKNFLSVYESLAKNIAYEYSSEQMGKRALKSVLLRYLMKVEKEEYLNTALQQLKTANNMTDEISALRALSEVDCEQKEEATQHFYEKWKNDTLVMNKWLGIQAISPLPGALDRVQRLMQDPVFNINNPNKVYSLLYSFGRANHKQFHSLDGKAYAFMTEVLLDIDTRNSSVASRLVSLFNQWKRYDLKRQELMKKQLEKIVAHKGVSAGVYEIASKALL